MLPDLWGLEWWRVAWVPALSAALIWFASVWKTQSDTRGARDQRLDGRQEREIARLDTELDEERKGRRDCEEDRDRLWHAARKLESVAHDTRHEAHRRLMTLALEYGAPVPDKLPEIPALHTLLQKPTAD